MNEREQQPQQQQQQDDGNDQDNNELIRLFVWPSEWSLPSLDPESLCAMCYLKFTGIPHKIEYIKNPLLLFRNKYPRLEHNKMIYEGLDEIVDYIKTINNIDSTLNDTNYADMLALVNYFKQKFIPAFIDLSWLDPDNTYKVTRSAYGKHIKFPLSIIKLRTFAKNAENMLTCNYKSEYIQYENLKQQILIDAKDCLNIISTKLNDKLFVFENRPSLIDSIIFGYLSILHRAPYTLSPLKNHLLGCTNLCSLINRINIEYFPLTREELENRRNEEEKLRKQKQQQQQQKQQQNRKTTTTNNNNNDNDDEWSWENQKKNQLFAVGFALTAMIIYAYSIGFLKIEIIKTDIVQEPVTLD